MKAEDRKFIVELANRERISLSKAVKKLKSILSERECKIKKQVYANLLALGYRIPNEENALSSESMEFWENPIMILRNPGEK